MSLTKDNVLEIFPGRRIQSVVFHTVHNSRDSKLDGMDTLELFTDKGPIVIRAVGNHLYMREGTNMQSIEEFRNNESN